MMRTVHKFPIEAQEVQLFRWPAGARVRHIACQRGMPQMWVELDTALPEDVRRFVLVGTGHPLPAQEWNPVWCGTYLCQNDCLVFHVYETLLHPVGGEVAPGLEHR